MLIQEYEHSLTRTWSICTRYQAWDITLRSLLQPRSSVRKFVDFVKYCIRAIVGTVAPLGCIWCSGQSGHA